MEADLTLIWMWNTQQEGDRLFNSSFLSVAQWTTQRWWNGNQPELLGLKQNNVLTREPGNLSSFLCTFVLKPLQTPQKQAAGVRGHGRKRERHHFLFLLLQRLVERTLIQLFAKPALAQNVLRLFFNLLVSEEKSSSVVILGAGSLTAYMTFPVFCHASCSRWVGVQERGIPLSQKLFFLLLDLYDVIKRGHP